MLNVGISIVLRTCCSINRLTILRKENHLFKSFAIFRMQLSVKNERLSHLIIPLAHQSFLHLILDILNGDVVVHVKMIKDLRYNSQVSRFLNTFECLNYGIHNFVKREQIFRSISFSDGKVFNFHFDVYIYLSLIISLLFRVFFFGNFFVF